METQFPIKQKKQHPYWDAAFGDPDENRTRVTAVKGRCLNRLTTGPIMKAASLLLLPYLVAAVGLEPTTPRV